MERALNVINNTCRLGIVIETKNAIKLAKELNQLPLSHIHIGLNDLRDALQKPHSFYSLIDQTIDNLVNDLTIPYGFGGLTIPCQLLMGELIRLQCSFSLLRHSFITDIFGKNWQEELTKIRLELNRIKQLSTTETQYNHQKFKDLLLSIALLRE
ncbi:MAG: hypothetical protein IGQ45_11590 [Cyanobacterium sp. T60_A2020_053]|nr:hypothetical protein [Cyanobacterium sp. T60_A2020_053]